MRTNIVLDDNLVKKALKLSGINTKKELINTALVSEYERGVAEAKGGQVETPEAESGERSEAA